MENPDRRLFGGAYFAARGRLLGVVRGIADFARHTGMESVEAVATLRREPDDPPFVFMVCGEVNAGKSAFINGLFGIDLCKVNVLPETAKVIRYRHSGRASVASPEPLLEERGANFHVLRDFQVIDTPGINARDRGHLPVIARLLPEADVIFCVLPIANPWSPATWDFIPGIPEHLRDRIVIVIQQADQRDPEDVRVILGHMKDLAMKRMGCAPVTFAVSGKLASPLPKGTPAQAPAWPAASGYPLLADYLSTHICGSRPRKQGLEKRRALAAAALRAMEDSLEAGERALSDQDRFLNQIEGEIDGMREHFTSQLPEHLVEVAEIFRNEASGIARELSRQLGSFRSIYRLFTGDRTAHLVETLFTQRMRDALLAVGRRDAADIADACRSHWDGLSRRVEEAIGIRADEGQPLEETLGAAQSAFSQSIGRHLREGTGIPKVRSHLDEALRNRNIALKSFTFMTLALITAGGTCGALSIPWLPHILCGAALLFLLCGLATAKVTGKRAVDEFRERLLEACGGFARTLRADYEDALRGMFQDYRDSLRAVRSHIADRRSSFEPKMKRWNELFLLLSAARQDD